MWQSLARLTIFLEIMQLENFKLFSRFFSASFGAQIPQPRRLVIASGGRGSDILEFHGSRWGRCHDLLPFFGTSANTIEAQICLLLASHIQQPPCLWAHEFAVRQP
jgi:hypothetical protein